MAGMIPLARALALLAAIGELPTLPVMIGFRPQAGNAIIANAWTDQHTTIWINSNGPDVKGHDAIVIAGIIAHEQWHVDHGDSEIGAYRWQLTVLQMLGADDDTITRVTRTLQYFERNGR